MKQKTQSGSAHLIIIIVVIVVSIIAALGLVFYKNFVMKKPATDGAASSIETQTQTQSQTATGEYADFSTYKSERDGYSIKYPNDWIVIKETDDDGPYIRNFDPSSKMTAGGYPDGYVNVRILRSENNDTFQAETGLTTTQWYETIGISDIDNGAVTYAAEDVKQLTVNGLPAKSVKSVFTETNEDIYLLKGGTLYLINLYPYGSSTDSIVQLMLNSFEFL